jgi:hypothetical protein
LKILSFFFFFFFFFQNGCFFRAAHAKQMGSEAAAGVKQSRTTGTAAQSSAALKNGSGTFDEAPITTLALHGAVENIDAHTAHDPQECVEIVDDIYEHLR